MTNSTATPAAATAATRVAAARSIGKGIRITDTTVAEILAYIEACEDQTDETFDHKARGAVAGLVSTWINGDEPAPAQKTGPKGDQTLTDYGRGFDRLVSAVKRELSETPAKSESLTVTYVDAEGVAHKATVTREHAELWANLTSLTLADADE